MSRINLELDVAKHCRYGDFITQLPFELKLTMPKPDRGGQGYSDELIAQLKSKLKENEQ